MADATLDDLLERLDDLDNENLAAEFRKVIKDQARQITERDERLASFERKERTDVLKQAGVTEKAYDRFLRDWKEAHGDDEFTVENVKAAADEFGYRLETAEGAEASPAAEDDPAEVQRQQAEQARRALQTEGVVDVGLPPADLDQRITAAEQAGDREAVFQLKQMKLAKAS